MIAHFANYAIVVALAVALTVGVLLTAAGLIDSPESGPCSPPLHRGVVQYAEISNSGTLVARNALGVAVRTVPLYGCVR